MNLNRKRLCSAEHFKQEGQLTKTLRNGIAQQGGFIVLDNVAQSNRLAVSAQNLRTAFRMRTHPQLSHRLLSGVGNAIEFR